MFGKVKALSVARAGGKEDVTGLGAALGGYGRLSSLGLTGQESSVSEREWERPCGGWAEEGRSQLGSCCSGTGLGGPWGALEVEGQI